MSESIIGDVLTAAGGIPSVAKELELSNEAVRIWLSRGIPDKRVLWIAERTGWSFTPHQIAPILYPHPDDGLPESIRSRKPDRGVVPQQAAKGAPRRQMS